MKFTLPGQLRGPECRIVIQEAIKIRKKLEQYFNWLQLDNITELCLILRIDGSLGSFGQAGIEDFKLSRGTLSCDLVIKDYGWENTNPQEIFNILKENIIEAFIQLNKHYNLNFNIEDIQRLLSNQEVTEVYCDITKDTKHIDRTEANRLVGDD